MMAVQGTGSQQSSLRHIDAAALGLCALASVLWYVTTAQPLVEQRSAGAQQRHEVQSRQEEAVQLKAGVAKVKERLAAVGREQAAGAIQLDSAARINQRVAALTEFLAECHLQVDDVRTGRASRNIRYNLIPITVVGRGPYRECVKFFHGLCAKCPDMSVMRIDLAGNPAEPADPETFRLELFWYAAPGGPVQNAVGEKRPDDGSAPSQGQQL
jgi:Tfp pilus assembly protein PilO